MEQKNVHSAEVECSHEAPALFENAEHGWKIRCVVKDGEPLLIAKDVCGYIGVTNVCDALAGLDDDEKGIVLNYTLGGKQEMLAVTEPGFYSLVLRCRKRSRDDDVGRDIRRFQRWVTHEVLPSIRKHGMYATPKTVEDMLNDPDVMIGLLQGLKAERARAEQAEKQAALEQARADEAERTRGWIRDKQLASAMGTASAASKRAVKAEARAELAEADSKAKDGIIAAERARGDEWAGRAEALQYRLDTNDGIVRAPDEFFLDEIPEVQEIFDLSIDGAGSQIGKNLAACAKAYGIPPRKPDKKRRGSKYLETLHRRGAIELWLESLRAVPSLLAKYRRANSAA